MADFDDPAERSEVGAGARGGREEKQDEDRFGGGFGTGLSVDPMGAPTSQTEIDRLESFTRDFETAAESTFGKRLLAKLKEPKTIGAIGGALLGGIAGIGPAAGAKVGSGIGSLFDDDAQKGAGTPSITQAPAVGLGSQIAQTSPQVSAVGQFAGLRAPGFDEARQVPVAQAQPSPQVPQVARVSGLVPQQPVSQPFLQTGGILPLVNIGAFPGALGRIA